MEAKMTRSALWIQDAVLATMFFQDFVSESSTRNPSPVDSIIPPSAGSLIWLTCNPLISLLCFATWRCAEAFSGLEIVSAASRQFQKRIISALL